MLHSDQSRCFYDGTSFFDILSASYIHCALENMHYITFVFALYRCRVSFFFEALHVRGSGVVEDMM